MQVDEQVTLALTAEAVRKAADAEPVAVICGGETGVKAGGGRTSLVKKGVETGPHLRGLLMNLNISDNRNLQFAEGSLSK